jgi:hypothetical protein
VIASAFPVGVNVALSFVNALVVVAVWKFAWEARLGSLRYGWKVTSLIVLGAWVIMFALVSMAPVDV